MAIYVIKLKPKKDFSGRIKGMSVMQGEWQLAELKAWREVYASEWNRIQVGPVKFYQFSLDQHNLD